MIKVISVFLVVSITACLIACGDSKKSDSGHSQDSTVDSVTVKPQNIEYGFDLDSFRVIIDTVRKNWTLSHLLLPYGVSQYLINKADEASKDSLVNLKYIKDGKRYTVLCAPGDTSNKALYCIYEQNKVDYIVFDFTDGVEVTRGKNPVTVKRRRAAGRISSSLWNAFIDQGLSGEMVMRVVNTYQWSVDFFSIQPGDYYRMIYDEKILKGERVGSGKIHGLEIHTYDSSYYAIPFEKDTISGFFDFEGGSLRKALLKAPLDFIRISSSFSMNRLHPVLGYYRPHLGVDYAAPYGTPVVSVGDGKVIFAGWSGGAGNLIKIKHNDRITTFYMHLQKINVRNGEHVSQGQLIGEVGSTGLSTGPHLDYRININGKFVDPVSADIPSADPLPEVYLPEFRTLRDSILNLLNAIKIPDLEPHKFVQRDTLEQIRH